MNKETFKSLIKESVKEVMDEMLKEILLETLKNKTSHINENNNYQAPVTLNTPTPNKPTTKGFDAAEWVKNNYKPNQTMTTDAVMPNSSVNIPDQNPEGIDVPLSFISSLMSK